VFCPFSEAVLARIRSLIEQYLGSVVPYTDNFFATLNSAGVLGRLVRVRAQGACVARWRPVDVLLASTR